MANPTNPMERTYPHATPGISQHDVHIAGIMVSVFGLDELPAATRTVTCLWLLHPRLSQKEWMTPLAALALHRRLAARPSSAHGLIAASFDQRNHGARTQDPNANAAWRNGNPRHAQDMFSQYHGGVVDLSALITYLPAYIFLDGPRRAITSHMLLGVSLGGHAGWHAVLHEERVRAAVIVIGCADYIRLMTDRARLSKREAWLRSDPPGKDFLGSEDFPTALVEAVRENDPAGFLTPNGEEEPAEEDRERVVQWMERKMAGKRILNLAGGSDKLVPYSASVPFLNWLKKAIAPGGWFDGYGLTLEDEVFEGAGHEMKPAMLDRALEFIDRVVQEDEEKASGQPKAKI